MIKFEDQTFTPKQAAKLIVEEGIDQNLTHWEDNTYSGEELVKVMTTREHELVRDQIRKILWRIDKLLNKKNRGLANGKHVL